MFQLFRFPIRSNSLAKVVPVCCLALLLAAIAAALAMPPSASSSNDEWTFEKARQQWTPMWRPVTHVGVPGYQFQAGVLWDGSLVFGPLGFAKHVPMQQEMAPLGNYRMHVSVGYGNPLRFVDRAATGNPAIRRSLEDGRLPIPHVETRDGELLWEEVVFAHLLGRKAEEGMQPRNDDMLVVRATFTVRNTSAKDRSGRLWLHFANLSQVDFGYKAGINDKEVGASLDHRFEAPFGVQGTKVRYLIPKPAEGSIRWHSEIPAPEGMKGPLTNVIEWEVPLAAGRNAQLELVIPYGFIDRSSAEALAQTDGAQLGREVRNFWNGVISGPAAITTPDAFVNDYLTAVVVQMAQQIGYRHKSALWMYKTSPNHYEHYWPCNAAKALPTLDIRGLARYSRPVLKSFIDFQSEDVGALTKEHGKDKLVSGEGFAKIPGFMGNFGGWTANTLLLSHGLEMWALASHYRITRDRAWLGNSAGSPLQALLDAFDWVAQQRRRTMREENGKKVPHWGLLPAASAHDWLSGNTIFNDAFCIFGMLETVRLLREIGHPRAEELAKELSEYRACLRQRYMEARDQARPLPMPDGRLLPYVPRDVYELDWAKVDWTYTGYGPLRAGAWGALDPSDELVNQSLAFLETGLPKGDGFYFTIRKNRFGQPTADENFRDVSTPDAPRHFLWKHYVEYETMWPIGMDLFLQRDDLPRFFEWFFNNMAMVVHHDFRVGVESLDGVPSNAPGEGERWRAVRNMFVNERGGYDGSQQSLWLLQAIPRSWLKPGARLSANEMGTHFGGRVTLDVHVAPDGNSVEVAAKVKLAVAPVETRMRLRSGDGRPLASAAINGKKVPVLKGDIIRLPAQTSGDYRITGYFR